jgi:hypothetical protein
MGLLNQDDYEQLSSRAMNTGLLNGVVNLLASGGQGWGRAVANGLAGGLQGYQGTFDNAQQQKLLQQKMAQQEEENAMLRQQFDMQMQQWKRQQDQDAKRETAIGRLAQGKKAYTTEQEVPIQSFQNIPMASVDGQAPNFNLQRQPITTMQKQPVFNEQLMNQDMVAAGYGDKLLERQLFPQPKKTSWQDIGGEFVQLDEAGEPTGKKMPKSMAPKEPQIFSIKKGRTEIQYFGNMSNPDTWQQISTSSMDAPQRDSQTMIAVPDPTSPTGFRNVPSNRAAGLPAAAPTGSQKAPTEFQAKAGLYFGSMRKASETLNALEDSGVNVAPGTIEQFAPGQTAQQVARDPNRKSYVQAQRQWIDSINRVRSGANLPEIEYERAVMTFFPQYNDGPAEIAQKRSAREQEEALMLNAAGPAGDQFRGAPSQQVNIMGREAMPPKGAVREKGSKR